MDGAAALPERSEGASPRGDPPAAASRPAWPPLAGHPARLDPKRIHFDFDLSRRVLLPAGELRICLRDRDTGDFPFRSKTLAPDAVSPATFPTEASSNKNQTGNRKGHKR